MNYALVGCLGDEKVCVKAGDGLIAMALPCLGSYIGNAAAELGDMSAGIEGLGPGGANIVDGQIDRAGHAMARAEQVDLRHCGQFEEGADHAAMQGLKRDRADKLGLEWQDGGHLVALDVADHAQGFNKWRRIEEGCERFGSGWGRVAHVLVSPLMVQFLGEVSAKAPLAEAMIFSLSGWKARALIKATVLVT